MDRYSVCTEKDLGEGVFLLEKVMLSSGAMCDVYFGPGGVFVVSEANQDAKLLYEYLNTLIGTARLKLFIPGFGIYEQDQDPLSRECSDEELTDEINRWICPPPVILKPTVIQQFIQSLQVENGKSRGYYQDSEGNLFVYRHDRFYPASPFSPKGMYMLTLFGGPLGLHRFAMGHMASGLFYLLTAGLFGIGWLLDVLLLLAGRQRDRKKRLLLPPKKSWGTVVMLPLGLFVGGMLIWGYFHSLSFFSTAMHGQMLTQMNSATPSEMEAFVDFFLNLFPNE